MFKNLQALENGTNVQEIFRIPAMPDKPVTLELHAHAFIEWPPPASLAGASAGAPPSPKRKSLKIKQSALSKQGGMAHKINPSSPSVLLATRPDGAAPADSTHMLAESAQQSTGGLGAPANACLDPPREDTQLSLIHI